jgi:hypothetical protein
MTVTRRQAEAARAAIEDFNLVISPDDPITSYEAVEARIATMNAEAGRFLAEDLNSLMWANERATGA